MKEGNYMHDGYNELTPNQVRLTFAYAIFKVLLVLGWAFLLYRNVTDNDPNVWVIVWGGVCGFFTAYQITESVKWWRRWWKEHQELKRLRDAGEIFD